MEILSWQNILSQHKRIRDTPPVGLEPTTFELDVQRANPLRNGGLILVLGSLSYILSMPYRSFVSLVLSDNLTFVGG